MSSAKKILLRILVYAAPLMALLIYMEFRLGRMENSYSYKMKQFEKTGTHCRMLILGNSEMLKAMNPSCMHIAAFNMAHVSQDLGTDEAIFRRCVPEMPDIQYVMLGLNYLSFGERLDRNAEQWRLPFYNKYYRLDVQHDFDIKDYSNILRYTPYESLKLLTKNFNADLLNGMQPDGWMKTVGCDPGDTTPAKAKERAAAHTSGLKDEHVNYNIEKLRNMLELSRNKYKVIVVQTPVMPAYYSGLDQKWLHRNDSIIKVLENEYHFILFDYTKGDPLQPDAFHEGFNDVNHLNERGTRKLCRLICDSLSGVNE